MATVRVYLETRKLDREYAQPFVRDAEYGDIIEIGTDEANVDFIVTMSNSDYFITKQDGNPAGTKLNVTINSSNSVQWEVAGGPLLSLVKHYDVFCVPQQKYADRPGASPPKIIVTG